MTSLAFSAASVLQVLVGVWLFARSFPEKGTHPFRPLIVAAVMLVLLTGITGVSSMLITTLRPSLFVESPLVPSASETGFAPATLLTIFAYSCLELLVAYACVRLCFDLSTWNALACCAAGYTMQNIASSLMGLIGVLASPGASSDPVWLACVFAGTWAAVYVSCWFLVLRRMELGRVVGYASRGVLGLIFLVILAVIGFDILNRSLLTQGAPLVTQVLYRLLHLVICASLLGFEYQMLYVGRLRMQVAASERLEADRTRQLDLTRTTIAAIEARCHDIRHAVFNQLAQDAPDVDRETLKAIAHEVDVFDAEVKTGNATVDTILTEKRLICEARGVTLSCIVDGTLLEHIPDADLYGLFDTLLGAAIDDAGAIEQRSARSVALQVRRRGAMVVLHEEHSCVLGAADALWEREARTIAERYGGTLAVAREKDQVRVNLLLPAAS